MNTPLVNSATYLWKYCLNNLSNEISEQQFNTWIRPLQCAEHDNCLYLYAPNRLVIERVNEQYLSRIYQLLAQANKTKSLLPIKFEIGSCHNASAASVNIELKKNRALQAAHHTANRKIANNIKPYFTFDTYVEGGSNQLAKAAAIQVAENLGIAYNPLFLYGRVGLGKTHLAQAIANLVVRNNPGAKILYLHSERFVADMVRSIQKNAINEFKRFYRNVNCLLIDDIQFFAGKGRSQEEFFHTFNTLLDGNQQIVLTCDRYPKEINNLEERLKSRFGCGLTVSIEPPELDTRVAILMSKAAKFKIGLNREVASFIARHIQSNVRELEGALKRVMANAHFSGQTITMDCAKEALDDLLTLQERLITIDSIKKTVGEYYKIHINDLEGKSRYRKISRPRQMAMALAKDLTSRSLPEIGGAFGRRDHTTVLHACRKIRELLETDSSLREDYKNLLSILSA